MTNFWRRRVAPAAVLVAVSALAIACGSAKSPKTTTQPAAPPGQSATETAPQTNPAGSSCATSDLSVWLERHPGGGAMGSQYYLIKFKNASDHTCQLRGFPGVAAYGDGHQIGRSASWDSSVATATVVLDRGETAQSLLRISNVGAYPAEVCGPVTATSLKVYPPNQTTAVYLGHEFGACSLSGPGFLGVQPVQATGGTSGGQGQGVVSSKVALAWQWPNLNGGPYAVKHSYPVPPLPVLRAISVGRHEDENPAFDRISFTFTGTFPSYDLLYVSWLDAQPSGNSLSLDGDGFLRVRFVQAVAHDASGHSTVQSGTSRYVGYRAIAAYAQAQDFEGVVTYGVGSFRTVQNSNVQPRVRAIEVKKTDGQGGFRYIVAIDIQTKSLGKPPGECPSGATLLAALPAKVRPSVTRIAVAACADGWAVAVTSRDHIAETWVFRERNGQWIAIDREGPCRTGEIPQEIHRLACHTN